MSEIINAKGLACPQPVILTKKALEAHNEITVLVDNTTAVENIKRFASSAGCSVKITNETGGTFRIDLKKQAGVATGNSRRKTFPAVLTPVQLLPVPLSLSLPLTRWGREMTNLALSS